MTTKYAHYALQFIATSTRLVKIHRMPDYSKKYTNSLLTAEKAQLPYVSSTDQQLHINASIQIKCCIYREILQRAT